MKAVAKIEVRLTNDPKPMDRATWQRIRGLVELEAVHRDWGCALYTLHRLGRIDNDQREAGDRYVRLISDWRKLWHDPMLRFGVDDSPSDKQDVKKLVKFGLGHVVADALESESEFEQRRAKKIGDRYREARAVAGPINSVLESMLIDEIWPTGEKAHQAIGHALTRLSHFFNTGTKRKH